MYSFYIYGLIYICYTSIKVKTQAICPVWVVMESIRKEEKVELILKDEQNQRLCHSRYKAEHTESRRETWRQSCKFMQLKCWFCCSSGACCPFTNSQFQSAVREEFDSLASELPSLTHGGLRLWNRSRLLTG